MANSEHVALVENGPGGVAPDNTASRERGALGPNWVLQTASGNVAGRDSLKVGGNSTLAE